MANRVVEKWTSVTSSGGDWLREQVWYQQARGKWDELDPQKRFFIQLGVFVGAMGAIGMLLLAAYLNVRALRTDVSEKNELLSLLQNATEEMRKLRDTRVTGDAGGAWPAYFEQQATQAGMDPASMLTVSAEKAGNATDLAKEALFDLSLKKVSVRQVIKFAHGLETGARPIKIRHLLVDTKADPEGYQDATLSVSAFTWLAQP